MSTHLLKRNFSQTDYNGPQTRDFIERARMVMLAKDEFLAGNPNFDSDQLDFINNVASRLFEQLCEQLETECDIAPNPNYYSQSDVQVALQAVIKHAVELIQRFSLKIMRLCDADTPIHVLAKQFYDAEARVLFREPQPHYHHEYLLEIGGDVMSRFSSVKPMFKHTKPSTARGILINPGEDVYPQPIGISNFRRQSIGRVEQGDQFEQNPNTVEFSCYRHSSFPTIEIAGDDDISRYRRMQGALMSVRQWLEGIATDYITENACSPDQEIVIDIGSLALLSPSFLVSGKECEERQLRESFDALMMCNRNTFFVYVKNKNYAVTPRITFMNSVSNDFYLQPKRRSEIEKIIDPIGMCHFTNNVLTFLASKLERLPAGRSPDERVIASGMTSFVDGFLESLNRSTQWKTLETQYRSLLREYVDIRRILDSTNTPIADRATSYSDFDAETLTPHRKNLGRMAADVIALQRTAWTDSLQILAASILDQIPFSDEISEEIRSLRDIVVLFINACDLYFTGHRESAATLLEFQPRYLLCQFLCGMKVDTFCKSGEDRTGFVLSEVERLLTECQLDGEFPILPLGVTVSAQYHSEPFRVAIRQSVNAFSVNTAVANANAPGARGLQFGKMVPAVKSLAPKVSTKLAKIARKPYNAPELENREGVLTYTPDQLHHELCSQQILAPSLRAYCLELPVGSSTSQAKFYHYQAVDVYNEEPRTSLRPTSHDTVREFNLIQFPSDREFKKFLYETCLVDLTDNDLLLKCYHEHNFVIQQLERIQNNGLRRLIVSQPWRFDLTNLSYECVNQLNFAHDALPINPDDKKHLLNILAQTGICATFSHSEIALLCHEQRTTILRRIIDNMEIREMLSEYPVNPHTSTEQLIRCFRALNTVSMRHARLPKQFLAPEFLDLHPGDRERLQARWDILYRGYQKEIARRQIFEDAFPRSRVLQHFFAQQRYLLIDTANPAYTDFKNSVANSEELLELSLDEFSEKMNAFIQNADGSAFDFKNHVGDPQNIYESFIREARFRVFSESSESAIEKLNYLQRLLNRLDSSIQTDIDNSDMLFLKTALPNEDVNELRGYFDNLIAQLMHYLEQQPTDTDPAHPHLKKVNTQVTELQTLFGSDGKPTSSLLENIIEPNVLFVNYTKLGQRFAEMLETREARSNTLDNNAEKLHTKMEACLANIVDSLLQKNQKHLALGRAGFYSEDYPSTLPLDLLQSARSGILVIKMTTLIFQNHERFHLNQALLSKLFLIAQWSHEQLVQVIQRGKSMYERRIANDMNSPESEQVYKSNMQMIEAVLHDPDFIHGYEVVKNRLAPNSNAADTVQPQPLILVHDPDGPVSSNSLQHETNFHMFSNPRRNVIPLTELKPEEAMSGLFKELVLKEVNVAFAATTDENKRTTMAFWRDTRRAYNDADPVERRVILTHLEKRVRSTPSKLLRSEPIVFSGKSRAMLLDFVALCELIRVNYNLKENFNFTHSEIHQRQKVYLIDNPDLIASLQDYVGLGSGFEIKRRVMNSSCGREGSAEQIENSIVIAPVA